MTFEKDHELILVGALVNSDHTVMNVRLDSKFAEMIFRKRRSCAVCVVIGLTRSDQDLPWLWVRSAIQARTELQFIRLILSQSRVCLIKCEGRTVDVWGINERVLTIVRRAMFEQMSGRISGRCFSDRQITCMVENN